MASCIPPPSFLSSSLRLILPSSLPPFLHQPATHTLLQPKVSSLKIDFSGWRNRREKTRLIPHSVSLFLLSAAGSSMAVREREKVRREFSGIISLICYSCFPVVLEIDQRLLNTIYDLNASWLSLLHSFVSTISPAPVSVAFSLVVNTRTHTLTHSVCIHLHAYLDLTCE